MKSDFFPLTHQAISIHILFSKSKSKKKIHVMHKNQNVIIQAKNCIDLKKKPNHPNNFTSPEHFDPYMHARKTQ